MDDVLARSEALLFHSQETRRETLALGSQCKNAFASVSTAIHKIHEEICRMPGGERAEVIQTQADHHYLLMAVHKSLGELEPAEKMRTSAELNSFLGLPADQPLRTFSTAQLAAALLMME